MLRLDEFLQVTEAAAYLGVSPNTVRNWGQAGKIPEFRHPINNYRLYKRKDLATLLERIAPAQHVVRRRKPVPR